MHLCVQNAAFAWPGRPALFENLSFSIQTPSVTSVLGPNGAGKTTLLKCVLGFEKWTAGSETLDGIETSRLAPFLLKNAKKTGASLLKRWKQRESLPSKTAFARSFRAVSIRWC